MPQELADLLSCLASRAWDQEHARYVNAEALRLLVMEGQSIREAAAILGTKWDVLHP